MATQTRRSREVFHVRESHDLAALVRELNLQLSRVSDAIDEAAGLRGAPKFFEDIDAGGNRLRNVGAPKADTDAQPHGLSFSRSAVGQPWDAQSLRVQHLDRGRVSTDAVNLGQLDAALAVASGALAENLPVGVIVIWSGSTATIPARWQLCVTGDTLVTLADGTYRRIDEIVNQRQAVEVLSFNAKTERIETKRVIEWFKSPATRNDWMKLKISRSRTGGSYSLTCTDNHPVWIVGRGWIEAKDVKAGDRILRYEPSLNLVGRQAVMGMLLGDGHIEQNGVFKVTHGLSQEAYLRHIADRLGVQVTHGISKSGYGTGLGFVKCQLALQTLAPDFVQRCVNGKKVRRETLSELGAVGLAYWYMDDGNLQQDGRSAVPTERAQFHTEGFDAGEIDLIIDWFSIAFGIKASAYRRQNTRGVITRLDADGSERLWQLIAPYIHPSVRYKLPPRFQDVPYLLADEPWIIQEPVPFYVHSGRISDLGPSKRNLNIFKTRYDIKVEDNASFIANRFIVHNCDGTNGTPDLRDRFIVGAGSTYAVGANAGATTHTHTDHPALAHSGTAVANHAAQAHSGTAVADHASHTHDDTSSLATPDLFAADATAAGVAGRTGGPDATLTHAVTQPSDHAALAHSVTQPSDHAAQSHASANHLPPYYALAYIQKVS